MNPTLQTDMPLYLHHLCLETPDVSRLAGFYTEHLDYRNLALQGRCVLVGPERALLIQAGSEARPRYLGYAVHQQASLEKLRDRLSRKGVACAPVVDPLFQEGSFGITDPQARQLVFGVSTLPASSGAPARLQHSVFQTTDLEAVTRFYVDVVGFTISDTVVDDTTRPMVVFMRSDDEHHSLAFFRGSRDVWDHHCYETTDWNSVRDWADRFAQAQVPIFFGPGRHGPGNNLFFMVTDPDGNHLEVSAELERVAAEKPAGVWPHNERTLNSWGRAWIRT